MPTIGDQSNAKYPLGDDGWKPGESANNPAILAGQEKADVAPAETQPADGRNARSRQVGGDHYSGMKIQPAEFCQANRGDLGYCECHAIGYICRHRKKNGAADIRKAIHCLELILELEYPE